MIPRIQTEKLGEMNKIAINILQEIKPKIPPIHTLPEEL